ncbi:MAG: DUF6291 domain-containing protein [Clostridiales bacterium]|nr:DUF6291 domain-containing protein [Clostridiales bacterium]
MAERKSFVIYKDWEKALSRLNHTQMGTLFLAIFAYMNRGQPYEGDDQVVSIAFDFVRIVLDRDNEKYQTRCAANARNGQKGGRPRKNAENVENPPETDGFADDSENLEEAAALPPEPAAPFEGLEEPAAFADYPPEPADSAEEYPPTPQTGDSARAFCAAARGRSPEPPACPGRTGGAAYLNPAGRTGYPMERKNGAASPNPAGRYGPPPERTNGAAYPNPTERGEDPLERARRAAYLKAQREKWEADLPPRAAPTGVW